MGLVHQLVVLVHLLAFALLLGGLVVQLRTRAPEVNVAMLHGSWLALVSGLVLWVWSLDVAGAGWGWAVAKLLATLVLTVVVVANRRFATIPRGLLVLLVLSSLAITAVGVLAHYPGHEV